MPTHDTRRTYAPDAVAVPDAIQEAYHKLRAETMFTNQAKSAESSSARPSYVPKMHEPPQMRELRDKNRRPATLPLASTPSAKAVALRSLGRRESVVATPDDVTTMLMALDLTHMQYAAPSLTRRGSQVPMDLPMYLTLILTNMERANVVRFDKVDMTIKLTQVFHKIDNDEDGLVTMSEFTSYILDAAAGLSEQGVASGLHEYNKTPTMAATVLKRPLAKMVYLPDADHFVAVESYSKTFQVYDTHDGALVATSGVYNGGVFVDAIHVPALDYVITSTTDATINCWDTAEFRLRQQLPTTDVQTVLQWNAPLRRLYAASVAGEISAWNVDTLARVGGFETHVADVTDVVFAQQSTLAVASLSAGIRIYDLGTHKLLKTLEGHHHGVSCLRYVTDQQYILSGGMDHDLRLWNPYVETSIARLKGHEHQLVGVEWVEGSHEILSADEAGIIRVWDIRKYRCVQTLAALVVPKPTGKAKPATALLYVPTKKRIVLASSALQFHDAYEWNATKDNSDVVSHASLVVYVPSCMYLVSIAGRHLRVWNAHTGALLHNLRHVTRTSISAACHGTGTTCYAGALDGHVYHINATNASILKERALHTQEVTGLSLLQTNDAHRLMTISLDGTCVIADMVSLAPLAELNHWHGVNCFPASRHDTGVSDASHAHAYHVPPDMRDAYPDFALDALKRIFTAYDPQDVGFAPLSAARDLFVAVTRVVQRSVYRINEAYVAAALAAFVPRRPGAILFAEFLHLMLDTWHGRGAVVAAVTAIAVSAKYNVVVTASLDGTFCVWSASTNIPVMTSPLHMEAGITALAFLEPHPLFVLADDHCGVSVYCIPPHPSRYRRLFEFRALSAIVRCLLWCPPHTVLAGDDLGRLTQLQVSGFFHDHAKDTKQKTHLRRLGIQQLAVRERPKRIESRRFSIHEFEYTRSGDVDALATWPAHTDAVCSLQVHASFAS
ncbi:hypothetical protein SPRG_08853 [Saprolegnia parasitica CBS 223.65]|uniref:EF-hand domain-containing protein n=1 Tax=Saprolegnia parasitica (strain CBS 223.65) TaxID=695850 RepID=A0A067CGG3_SAPPC|nr:hypothetical protein SPRG_08853 [Saprolegnia parasitica CBS 223.65]KDO25912.1 hypothetical protein SPRG_08853 [Saprolegnia parasitica CBS 223.65]|eukprot:XP_012203472.1 hypothetical protein SPRG_08853 [Saprolegnia parasitica CBS 223.65]